MLILLRNLSCFGRLLVSRLDIKCERRFGFQLSTRASNGASVVRSVKRYRTRTCVRASMATI